MLTVRSAFHLTHMVKNLEAATRLYENVFECPVDFAGFHQGENRDASFASVSDAYIELFAPRDAGAPDPASPGGRFIKRWGEGWANFGWLIEGDVQEAIAYCESKGYRLVYVAGQAPSAFFVHPRDAHGIMLEVMGGTIRNDHRSRPGWAACWREHPLGIERMNAVSYAVGDLEGAIGFIQSLAEAPIIYRGVDRDAGKESAYLSIADHVIELMQGSSDASEIGRGVREQGPKLHAVSFKVKALETAAAYLRQRGLRLLGREDIGYATIDPADMLGARYTFTDRAIPNDPRGT